MKTKLIFFSAILFPILVFSGCTITVGPQNQNEAPPHVTIPPSSEGETPTHSTFHPAFQIDQAAILLPPPPPAPNFFLPLVVPEHPSDEETKLNKMLSVLPTPPAMPPLTLDSDTIAVWDEPVQALGEEELSINYVNSYREEALPAGPPPVPAVPASD